ncbi:hypothetical protein BGZ54_004179 [Gamsiella multidivaricata]|nr:hypothetical protein BGZ54_004179 [Gamsiella multidivaricata]
MLGCVSNFSIIKVLDGEEAASMIAQYLFHRLVVRKNLSNEKSATSPKVFFSCTQTLVSSVQTFTAPEYHELRSDFNRIKEQRIMDQAALRDVRQAERSKLPGSSIQHHKPWQTFNRYRSVDPSTPQNKEAVTVEDTEMTAAQPSSSQKETPKYRSRYSVKVRTRKIEHEPPESMKQYAWKPWKKPPESPSGHNTDTSQQKNTNKNSSNKCNEKKDNYNGNKDRHKGKPVKPVVDMGMDRKELRELWHGNISQ